MIHLNRGGDNDGATDGLCENRIGALRPGNGVQVLIQPIGGDQIPVSAPAIPGQRLRVEMSGGKAQKGKAHPMADRVCVGVFHAVHVILLCGFFCR